MSETLAKPQVWKFGLPGSAGQWQHIEMPRGSQVLSVGAIGGEGLFVWAQVPKGTSEDWRDELRGETKKLIVCATGEDCPDLKVADFRGTYFFTHFGVTTVWHVFEEKAA